MDVRLRLAACAAAFVCCARPDAGRGPGQAASSGARPLALPRANVRFETPRGPWVVLVELARNEAQRARGLMYRTDLAQDQGMLFVFPETAEHTFWMHDTLLSLDMIFLDEARRVVGIVDRAPPRNDAPRSVGRPSRYVLEVSAGEASAHAVVPGTRAIFLDVPE